MMDDSVIGTSPKIPHFIILVGLFPFTRLVSLTSNYPNPTNAKDKIARVLNLAVLWRYSAYNTYLGSEFQTLISYTQKVFISNYFHHFRRLRELIYPGSPDYLGLMILIGTWANLGLDFATFSCFTYFKPCYGLILRF